MLSHVTAVLRKYDIDNPDAASEIVALFSNAIQGAIWANTYVDLSLVCDCEIQKPTHQYDENFRHIYKECNCIIINK